MIFCTGQMQLWQTFRTLPTKSDTFYREIRMLWKKKLHISAEIQTFLKCSPVHVKCTFYNSAWNFQLNMEEVHTEITKVMRKFEIVWKKISKLSSRIGKLRLVNSEQTRLCLIKRFSPVSPKNMRKTKFFEKLFFFKMICCTGQMQLWQTCRTLPPKSDTFYRKIRMLGKKCYTFLRKSKLSSNVQLYP